MEKVKMTGANGKPITTTLGARLPLSDYQRALELAARQGVTLSTWARQALQAALDRGAQNVTGS